MSTSEAPRNPDTALVEPLTALDCTNNPAAGTCREWRSRGVWCLSCRVSEVVDAWDADSENDNYSKGDAANDLLTALAPTGEPTSVWDPAEGPHTKAQYGNDPAHCMECTAAIQAWVTYPCRDWLSYDDGPTPAGPTGEPTEREVSCNDPMCDQTLDERDQYHEWADRLAYAIAPVEVIGEHTSLNNPWQNALDYAVPAETIDGQANDCTHASASGIDTTPLRDPDKVWRCDHCGLRWTTSNPASDDLPPGCVAVPGVIGCANLDHDHPARFAPTSAGSSPTGEALCGAAMPDYEDERRDGPFLCTFPKGHESPFIYAEGDHADDPFETNHGNPERGGFWSETAPAPTTAETPDEVEDLVRWLANEGEGGIWESLTSTTARPLAEALVSAGYSRSPAPTSNVAADEVPALAQLMDEVSTKSDDGWSIFEQMAEAVIAAGWVSPDRHASDLRTARTEALWEAAKDMMNGAADPSLWNHAAFFLRDRADREQGTR